MGRRCRSGDGGRRHRARRPRSTRRGSAGRSTAPARTAARRAAAAPGSRRSSDRYSRQPPTIAPSRFAANADVASAVVGETLREDQVGHEDRARTRPPTAASAAQHHRQVQQQLRRQQPGEQQGAGERTVEHGQRRACAIAGSPPRRPAPRRSTPAKTSAFTIQVVPNSSANPVMLRVSSSRNADAQEEQVRVRPHPPHRAAGHPHRHQADEQDAEQGDEVVARGSTARTGTRTGGRRWPAPGRPGSSLLARAPLVGRREAGGDDRLHAAEAVHARLVPERLLHGAGQPPDQPVLAVVVVHRERPAGREMVAHRLHRLDREQVALQPQRARTGDQRQRVGQREDDQVVLVGRCARGTRGRRRCARARAGPGTAGPDGAARRSAAAAGRSRPRRRSSHRARAPARRRYRCRRRRSARGPASCAPSARTAARSAARGAPSSRRRSRSGAGRRSPTPR